MKNKSNFMQLLKEFKTLRNQLSEDFVFDGSVRAFFIKVLLTAKLPMVPVTPATVPTPSATALISSACRFVK